MTTPGGQNWLSRGPQGSQAPPAVETAFKLWLLNVTLGLLSAVIALLSIDTLVEAAALESGEAAQMRDAAQSAAMAGILLGLVLVGLWLAVAFQMRKGKNWARIVMAVLGGIGLVMSLFSLGDAFSLPGVSGLLLGVLDLASTVIVAAALYFMFRPEANAYFARMR